MINAFSFALLPQSASMDDPSSLRQLVTLSLQTNLGKPCVVTLAFTTGKHSPHESWYLVALGGQRSGTGV